MSTNKKRLYRQFFYDFSKGLLTIFSVSPSESEDFVFERSKNIDSIRNQTPDDALKKDLKQLTKDGRKAQKKALAF